MDPAAGHSLTGRLVGLGCMRLSTAPDRDEDAAVEVIRAGLDAGVTLLDTADAYCHDERDVGHNERLVARALAGWSGDRSTITVATKGGLTRPGGRWVPDGRARHLEAACEASRGALGVDRIDLYQLHAPDPRTKLETSVRALARLRAAGLVEHVGLCNVTVSQLERARAIVEIAAVQVALGPGEEESLRNGVAERCAELGIVLIAHSPLGGPKGARRLGDDAGKVIAWLRGLSPVIVPIPGATRVETARSAAAAQLARLDDAERDRLDARWPVSRLLRVPRAERRPPDDADGEVVILMGSPAAGKSTHVASFVEQGYERLNRDERGGRLADLIDPLEAGLSAGRRRFVLDNTYPKRRHRNEVIEAAWRHGVPVRCVWLTTSIEDAQVNAVQRIVARHGRLPEVAELETLARDDPNMFPPNALFRYRSALEPPVLDEGYTSIDEHAFVRRRDPSYEGRAVIIEHDVLRNAPADVLSEVLRRHRDDGDRLLAISWQPGVAARSVTVAEVEASFEATKRRLGLEIEHLWCPHGPGPPVCWCRRPLPGLGVAFVERHRLDPAACLCVGRNSTDRQFARRVGFRYLDAEAFLSGSTSDPSTDPESGTGR